MKHILCGYDGSPESLKAAHFAADLARRYPASLTLLFVVEATEPPVDAGISLGDWFEQLRKFADQSLQTVAPEISKAAGSEVQRATRVGRPAPEITRLAEEQKVDLIVVGSHGRGAMKRLMLGSISDRVAHLATVPVLIVR